MDVQALKQRYHALVFPDDFSPILVAEHKVLPSVERFIQKLTALTKHCADSARKNKGLFKFLTPAPNTEQIIFRIRAEAYNLQFLHGSITTQLKALEDNYVALVAQHQTLTKSEILEETGANFINSHDIDAVQFEQLQDYVEKVNADYRAMHVMQAQQIAQLELALKNQNQLLDMYKQLTEVLIPTLEVNLLLEQQGKLIDAQIELDQIHSKLTSMLAKEKGRT